MSHRTVIEINHDYWHDLADDPDAMKRILSMIENQNRLELGVRGVRILGSRHHSETLKLTVK
jgi:hypothetical protein